MSILLRKHQGEIYLTKITKISIIGLLVAISSAFIGTIWAVYLDSFFHNISEVGFFSAILTLLSIAAYFFSIPLVERTKKSVIFSYSLLVIAATYFLFSLNSNLIIFIILSIVLTIVTTFRITSFGLIIKDASGKSKLSENEGLMYTFLNVAWIIGPLITGYILAKSGVSPIFVLAGVFMILGFILTKISDLKNYHIQKKVDKDLLKNFFSFFKNKDRFILYMVGGGISFWWDLIYLFMPLYILRNNLSGMWIGYFLFAVPIPLILFEYKFSKIAGKKGFKKFFKIGYLIPAIIGLICFFITDIFWMMGLLVLASIGMAMLEPTVETYFFNISTKKEEQRYYGPYNTKVEIFGFLGKALPSALLLFLPFKYIFLLFSGAMFLLFLVSFKLKEKRN
ncbi:hypothetical protein COU53_03760 [Candidatus Pacearchaeota archaeon CG10_big_fil_rev_8_21_14_0_10_30_48]|nr:MAG: hypothetical protein COU53_03760 [Candidatus Pacearchaeota archaeon CG10_big_fil_rev_8_21_14_0_10_30_48]